ncbi:MAG: type III-A CRISPR-associated RAMP protein Csm3 [Anaerolineae bacterium]|nr:type III-A CRISPR-associated RAMP protein Csm3 [Anaerolineae bacterium]
MSTETIKKIRLVGRVLIQFEIEAVTGLHIGGTDAGIEIGGVDKTVIRDKLTNRPYIPGSSLKGKMRSLVEKYNGLKQNQNIGKGSSIHSCGANNDPNGKSEYQKCDVCQVFGVPGERDFATPTRLVVRDTFLSEISAQRLNDAQTDLPYSEVKTEVSIDRVTSAANPRQMERVPAGAIFGDEKKPAEMVYTLYDGADCSLQKDVERLKVTIEGLKLIEDDYLGGLGSRGSGKVQFKNFKITIRARKDASSDVVTEKALSYPTLRDFEGGLKDDIQAVLK